MMPHFVEGAHGALLVATAVAASTDARSGRIPNALTVPLLLGYPPIHLVAGGSGALLSSLGGAVLCAIVPLLLFSRGAMGGGDVKLFAAIGAGAGPFLGMEVQFVAYVAAALYGACTLARRGALLRALLSAPGILAGRGGTPAQHGSIRLGIPIFLAALVCLVPWVAPP